MIVGGPFCKIHTSLKMNALGVCSCEIVNCFKGGITATRMPPDRVKGNIGEVR